MSRNNPFRKPALSEEVTVIPPPSPPLPALPHPTPSPPLPALPQRTASPPPPVLPSRSPTSDLPSQSTISNPSSHDISADLISALESAEGIDDLPPPYTPAANVGEETVSMGPSRPFQQPPPPSSFHPPPPPPDSAYRLNDRPPFAQPFFAGSGSSYDFRMQQGLRPRLGQIQQYRQRQNGGLLGVLFDTVREIADSVSGTSPYATTSTVYAPPPHPPPPRPTSAPPHSPTPAVPDDGSPTRTPVPGHPLLRFDHLLVYPTDYLCMKCKNTGYKNYDPSHPCRKCWEKYGRRYTGALAYTPWSSSRSDPRMQRALPKFLPPHLAGPSSREPDPRHSPPHHSQHNRSFSHPHSPRSPGPGPSYYVMDPLSPDPTPPVPHAIPVSPGDPRLGGRLCMRCGGAGVRPLLFIDVTTCDDCGGTGRIWV